MKKIIFNYAESVPLNQIEKPFIQGMIDRMCTGFHNYGSMRSKIWKSNNLKNVRIRIKKYKETKNTEFLMDAANYLMMEFVQPSVKDAFFKPTSKDESPGSIVDGRLVKGKEEYQRQHRVVQREGD